jgi:hypothetical protein
MLRRVKRALDGEPAASGDTDVARVRSVLSRHRDVTERRMMGTLAFMVGGSMCCSVGPEGLLVRVTAEERGEVLARPHVTPMRLGGRTMSGFVRVAPEGYRTRGALARWIERGLAAASSSRARRRRGAEAPAAGRRR